MLPLGLPADMKCLGKVPNSLLSMISLPTRVRQFPVHLYNSVEMATRCRYLLQFVSVVEEALEPHKCRHYEPVCQDVFC